MTQIQVDSILNIVTGVVRPLKDRGDVLKIWIEINAESEEGFDRCQQACKNDLPRKIEEWNED
ncbi:MAG: hypothetical protein ACE5J9_00260 [Methanosarcinales archaeon]